MARGRPTKLDADAAEVIVRILEIPQSIATACEAAGIDEKTYHNWAKRGKAAAKAAEKGEDVPEADAPFLHFFRRTKKARATGKVELLDVIRAVARDRQEPKRWQAAAWLLERMYPKEFGRRYIKLEASGPDDGPIQTTGSATVTVVLEGGAPDTPHMIDAAPGDDMAGD